MTGPQRMPGQPGADGRPETGEWPDATSILKLVALVVARKKPNLSDLDRKAQALVMGLAEDERIRGLLKEVLAEVEERLEAARDDAPAPGTPTL